VEEKMERWEREGSTREVEVKGRWTIMHKTFLNRVFE